MMKKPRACFCEKVPFRSAAARQGRLIPPPKAEIAQPSPLTQTESAAAKSRQPQSYAPFAGTGPRRELPSDANKLVHMAGADGVQRFPDALGRPVPPLQPKQRANRLFGKASSPRPRPEMSPTVGAPFLMGRAFEGHVHILFLAGAPFRRGNASPSLPAQAFRSLKTAPPQARPPAGGTYAALRQDASARRPCPLLL